MRILMATDAWRPQVNGVVNTLERLTETLAPRGIELVFMTPDRHRTLPVPTYPEIRPALTTGRSVARFIEASGCDHVHIVTEGPLGILARRYCMRVGRPFTSSYHTKFPEYVRARLPVPEAWLYAWLRGFHNAATATLVPTPSMVEDLSRRGFSKVRHWTRGVNSAFFSPERRKPQPFKGPIFLSVGRVAVEKNLPAFLDLDLPGSKVVVGEGPELERLKARYPEVHFLGYQPREALADIYASSDVFVFPSLTDTFGNVIIEALASGTPVAGFPVTGPKDIVGDGVGGCCDEDLRAACLRALEQPRAEARGRALRYTWDASADQFMAAVHASYPDRMPKNETRPLSEPGVIVGQRR